MRIGDKAVETVGDEYDDQPTSTPNWPRCYLVTAVAIASLKDSRIRYSLGPSLDSPGLHIVVSRSGRVDKSCRPARMKFVRWARLWLAIRTEVLGDAGTGAALVHYGRPNLNGNRPRRTAEQK